MKHLNSNMKGFVYLIHDEERNLYKIGVTKNSVEKRLKKLQTGNATELKIKDTHQTDYIYRIENMLHNHFNNKCVLNEWFELSNEDVNNFQQICNQFEETIKVLLKNPFFAKNLH